MAKSRLFAAGLLAALAIASLAGRGMTLSAGDQPIGEVTVTANPESFSGQCPVTVKFSGRIQVLTYPMSFNYQWERSDGGKGPVRVVSVPNPRTRTVTVVENWNVGGSRRQGQTFDVWMKLHVNSGNAHVISEPATATITCR